MSLGEHVGQRPHILPMDAAAIAVQQACLGEHITAGTRGAETDFFPRNRAQPANDGIRGIRFNVPPATDDQDINAAKRLVVGNAAVNVD